MDQAVKYIEDMQDDFDFRYKTLQSQGKACSQFIPPFKAMYCGDVIHIICVYLYQSHQIGTLKG